MALDLDQAVVVALGSNLKGAFASSEALLEAALVRLAAEGLRVAARSSWWRSASWPDPLGPEYRNGVALVETDLAATEVMRALLSIEPAFGRERAVRNAPRTLDLDLIAHGRHVLEGPGLTLPHPRAHERRFVVGPLAEIAPAWRHPVSGRTAVALAASATVGLDAAPVSRRPDVG